MKSKKTNKGGPLPYGLPEKEETVKTWGVAVPQGGKRKKRGPQAMKKKNRLSADLEEKETVPAEPSKLSMGGNTEKGSRSPQKKRIQVDPWGDATTF